MWNAHPKIDPDSGKLCAASDVKKGSGGYEGVGLGFRV